MLRVANLLYKKLRVLKARSSRLSNAELTRWFLLL
ncbi:hypothetical protein NIES2135_49830 [Leptolyngbya boryana NIES-2135]|uniref:Uncharacterized protein n=1 Tax=Leptolyngbya boryana NIES-2135 TaxID=1973484 RepID=A0A1Z4JN27_LEPBY|nr:hypothetical protein NIES2135_49830 [Leptolyngbya boryana NIES-2135]